MFWNVFIAVIAGLAQFGTSFLGWKVTSTDPSLTKKQKRLYDAAFICIGLAGIVFIGIAAYRAGTEHAHLKLTPDLSIIFNQPTLDQWAAFDQWMPINDPMRMNVNYLNVGNGSAKNVRKSGRVYIEPDDSLASARDAVSKYENWAKLEGALTITTFASGERGEITVEGDKLTPEDAENIKHGRRLIYEIGRFTFEDDFGSHYHDFCWYITAPARGGLVLFANCREHTEEK